MVIRGLVFDMDGLLFDTERIVQRSWTLSGAELGYPDIGEQIYNTIGFNRKKRAAYFKNLYGENFPHDVFQEKAAAYFMEIADKEGIPVKEGVREILAFAAEHRLQVGLATSSSSEYAVENLRAAGIYEYFDGFVCGNQVTCSKPDPEIYQKACQAISVQPEEAIAFEDAPAGIESAFGAGLKAVMIPDLVSPSDEILKKVWMVKKSLSEVIPFLREELEKQ